jgi:cell division protein FtsA
MPSKPVLAVGVDAGSSHTRTVVLVLDGARVRLVGFGETPSAGWKKGRIADQKAVADCILASVREAEQTAQVSVESAVFGLGGNSICGANGRGGYEIGFPRRITDTDVRLVINRASRVQLQEDEMLLHLFPQDFTVDGRPGHRNPRDVIGSRVEVYVHLVTTSMQEHQSLVGAANLAHLLAEETVFEPLAAAYAAVLPQDQREGIAVVDIGAHSTDLAVYYGEALVSSSSLPICGDHFTRDVARGLIVNPEDAEWIKEQHGCAMLGLTSDSSLIELPSSAGRGPRETTRRELNTILEARAIELFEFVEKELVAVRMDESLMALVLAGGGALLPGMCDVAEKILKCQARNGLAQGILDWPPEIDSPAWTTTAGLAMYSARLKLRADLDRKGGGILAKVFGND